MRTSRIRPAARVAALAALVVLGGQLAGCSAPALPAPGGVAPSVTVSGTVVPYDRAQAWTLASIPSRSSTHLAVFAVGSDERGGGPCGPPIVRLHAEESSATVRILVADYQQPAGDALACPAIGHVAGPQPVTLRAPLGGRKVVDASTGRVRTLLDGTDYPDLPTQPPGFGAPILAQALGRPAVERSWRRGTTGGGIRLDSEPPAAVRDVGPFGRIVQQLTIRGTPATVYHSGGEQYGQYAVQWTPNPRQTITLDLANGDGLQWTAAQAVGLARSVTGYATSPDQRLAPPTTPGTAAATYSSADGPVRHAAEVLKSSGVFVGVACQGAGEVRVSLRGATHPFRCTAALTRHVVRTTGKPFDTFFLDVTATDGVRWAVTLARASLDGS